MQLRSYRSESEETFPSIFFQGQVDAAAAGELVGKTVSMQMYLQRESGGPIAYTSNGALVPVKVESVAGGQLAAKILAASLVQTDVATVFPVAGTIQGVLP